MTAVNAVTVAPTSAVDPVVAEAMAMSARLAPLKNALGCSDLTNEEMDLFAMVALRSGMDPFNREIYAIKRKGKVTFQTGIDGFRSRAEDTGEYRGSDEPAFGPMVEEQLRGSDPRDQVRTYRHPEWARVVVRRRTADGELVEQSATAWWDEYYPGDTGDGFKWRQSPRTMLAKCAEAAAFRKIFPRRFGGVYVSEEMQQADAAAAATPIQATVTTHRDRIAQQRASLSASGSGGTPAAAQEPPALPAPLAADPSPDAAATGAGEGDADVIDGQAVEVAGPVQCDGFSAELGRCRKEQGHDGPHKNAEGVWPR